MESWKKNRGCVLGGSVVVMSLGQGGAAALQWTGPAQSRTDANQPACLCPEQEGKAARTSWGGGGTGDPRVTSIDTSKPTSAAGHLSTR